MTTRDCASPSAAPRPAPAAELGGLVAAVARGDRTAYARLYRAVAAPVYGTALRTLRSPSQAEEVAQEVLLEVWRTAAAYRPGRGTVMAWVLTIARRRAVDRARAARAAADRELRVALREQPVREPGAEPVAEQVERAFDAGRVRSALARLSGVQRESLVLAYYGGYSQREIARALGVPLGTVKTRMRDGLLRLRAAFDGA
ncbi:sigma-70 family RNA polymerase sigma factor [Kitasatospora sp. NPDC058444]|uniref:sigma-70 family RNA polymerase sigma factor n=1 Tax=Kitasatospora sp. NPDC058444 TaxID=3346504 RepID=UPI00365E6397